MLKQEHIVAEEISMSNSAKEPSVTVALGHLSSGISELDRHVATLEVILDRIGGDSRPPGTEADHATGPGLVVNLNTDIDSITGLCNRLSQVNIVLSELF